MDDFIRPKKRSTLHAANTKNNPAGDSSLPHPISQVEVDIIPEKSFRPPEQVADEDIMTASKYGDPVDFASEDAATHTKKKRRLAIHMPRGKKQWIFASAVLLLLFGGSASGYWFVAREPAKPTAVAVKPMIKEEVPIPTTEMSKLSGLEVPIGTNLKPVTAVMIENSPEARPQSGLKDASVIFEAISEGGITRFSALYQDTAPDYIGPVRSVRPYYLDWIWPFDASIAHVGGSPQALNEIRSLGIKDLDQFANSGAYERINSRFAPHNVYTSIPKLNSLQQAKGFTSANFDGFPRKVESKMATPTARVVNLNISSVRYNVQYIYDAATNSYMRSEGGQPHKDLRSGAQLSPKVVVAIVMNRSMHSDGQHTQYTTTGTGAMYVYQDGGVTQGTWLKDSRQAQWKFTDAAGKVLTFNSGQTWISMIDSPSLTTYTP